MAKSETKNSTCPCPNTKCVRHGDCAACQPYHAAGEKPPYCQRK